MSKKYTMIKGLKYAMLVVVGVLLILLPNLLFAPHIIGKTNRGDEYYFTMLLRANYSRTIFFIAGVVVGYFLRLNPWLSGLCLVAIFPLTSIVEATVYKGSHNLIPFEFMIHFIFALPAVIGVYVGRYVFGKRVRSASK